MVPASQAFKTDDPPRFQVDDWLIIGPNVIASDRRSQILFQQRPLADMRIHLRIEETALNVGISGARKRDVGASEKFVDGHVSAARLRDPHAGADTVMLYPDLNRFLDSLNERASNSMRGFRIRPRQTQREFVIANPRD